MMKKKTTAISLVISLMFACILVYITPTYAGITNNIELATGMNPNDPTSPLPVTPRDAQLSFKIAKSHYYVGDKLEVDLVENRNKFHHLHLDLWISIVFPDNTQLFVKNDSSNPLSDKPQRFNQKPLEQLDLTHRIMDTEVSSGMGGHYSFYAVYVVQGTNPMENFAVIRSNIAIAEISVDNRPCVKITCSVKELPPIENRPKPMELEFTGMKSRYLIGEQIQIDLVEKLETVSNPYHNVDLWVAAILPNGKQLFFVGGIFEKFTVEQKPFKEALSGLSNYSHRIFDVVVAEGMGGNYSFHAVYVKQGKNPMKDFTAIISNVAWIQIHLESR